MSEIINGVGRVGIRNYVPSNSNAFPTSNLFAYSFRKVVPTATLSCRVRRSADFSEQNIGFVGNDLDTASLLAFVNSGGVGAGSGWITTMYEQNGTGKDLTQTVASYQFKIADAGIVYTLNGKTSCVTSSNDAGPRYLQTTSLFSPSVITGVSIFSVTKLITQMGGSYNADFQYSIGSGVASQSSRLLDVTTLGTVGNPTTYGQYVEQGLSSITTPYTAGTKLQSNLIKSGNNKFYQNNILVGSNTTSLVTPDINQKLKINTISWGTPTWDSRANQYFSEILIYNSDETSNLTTIHNNINSYYSIYETAPAYTARTTAFAAATGITDTTILNALNTFDLGLISNGLDTKMKALYPFVGNTATTQKYNFMDARDLDVAFRLQFNGGWTHGLNGALGNGVNTYMNTYFNPSLNLTTSSAHQSAYLRLNLSIAPQSTYGCFTNFKQGTMFLYPYSYNIGWISDLFDASQSRVSSNSGNSTGHVLGTRASSSSNKLFRNGAQIASSSNSTNGVIPNLNYYIGAINNNGNAGAIDSNQIAFYSLGNGLTDGESTTFYNLVQAMQTALSRQV